jgi:predicted AlkP superfamily phosphohydrolase/phosphomutase
MADSLTELKVEVEKAEPSRLPSETRTIRLEGDILQKLEELAKQESVSISFIINKALRRHVEWEIYAEKFGFMMMFTAKMRRIYDSFTDEEARELGRQSASNEYSEFINFWFKKIDFDTTLKALEILGSEYARSFKFEHSFDGSTHTIIFKHDRGPRTSAYYAEMSKVLFNRLNMKVETVESDQQLTINVHN